jgi:hypothetical protein
MVFNATFNNTSVISWPSTAFGGVMVIVVVSSAVDLAGLYINIFLTCPFGQLTKKVLVRLNLLVVKKKINKNCKNQRIIISNLCKMFWSLSHKHYLVLSLLIQLTLIVSNSVDSNFWLSRIFIEVPNFVVYKYI